jgi:hypothetical protein
MSVISHILQQSARVLVTVLNRYGEQDYVSGVNELCRFREIIGIQNGSNQELVDADAMTWHEATSTVEEGSIMRIDNKFYRVEKVVNARKMGGNIEFKKCYLQKYTDVTEVS